MVKSRSILPVFTELIAKLQNSSCKVKLEVLLMGCFRVALTALPPFYARPGP